MDLKKLRLELDYEAIPLLLKKLKIQDEFALFEIQVESLVDRNSGFEHYELSQVASVDYTKLYSKPQFHELSQLSSITLKNFPKPSAGLSVISAIAIENFCLAGRLLFYCGKYEECFELVEKLAFPKSDLENFKPDAYDMYQLVQILGISGSLFRLKKMDLPKEYLEFVWKLFVNNSEMFADLLKKYVCWKPFVSATLFSVSLFYLSKGDISYSVKFIRIYLQYMSFSPMEYDPFQRIILLRSLLRLFLFHVRPSTYSPLVPVFDAKNLELPQTLPDELSLVLSLYEFLVYAYCPFPNAGQGAQVSEILYDEITLAYSIFSPYQSPADAFLFLQDQEQKENNSQWREVKTSWGLFIDCMYRATRKIFRSKTILRRLGLISMLCESIDEAYMSFKTYLEKDRKDKSQNDWWKNAPIHPMGDRHAETVLDVLSVLISACRLCLETHQTQLALIYIEKAVSICKDNSLVIGRLMYSVSYYLLGASYSRLGLETLEHEHFCNLQDQAHLMLREAERFDPDDWRIHYSIAAQAAEMGQTRIALDHIKESLRLNPLNISSWHVVVLLNLSYGYANGDISEYEAVKKALQMCETAYDTLRSGRKPYDCENPRIPSKLSREQLDHWLNLQLTHILIEECLAHQKLSFNHEKRPEDEKFSSEPKYTDVLDGYRELFDIFERAYFRESVQTRAEPVTTPLFSSGEKVENNISPLPHIVEELNDGKHPVVASLYPTIMNASDAYGFAFSSGFFPATADPIEPIHFAWFSRKRKHRYMEIWNQLAQVFRRANKYHDARVACTEAQKVERGNADIEFELGLISLFNSSTAGDETSTQQPSSFGLIRNMDDPLPDILKKDISLSEDEPIPHIRKAIEHFQAALTYDDEHLLARTWLGRCFYLQKRFEIARAELERAVKGGRVRGPKVWHACHQLGRVYIQLENYDKATEYLASALKNASFCVSLMMMRGFEVVPRYV